MSKYCALLVSADGDYVTDYFTDTKEKVVEALANRGSAWFFYPFEFVVTPKLGRIVDAPGELSFFKGKSVKKVLGVFERTYKKIQEDPRLKNENIDVFDYMALLEQNFRRREVS